MLSPSQPPPVSSGMTATPTQLALSAGPTTALGPKSDLAFPVDATLPAVPFCSVSSRHRNTRQAQGEKLAHMLLAGNRGRIPSLPCMRQSTARSPGRQDDLSSIRGTADPQWCNQAGFAGRGPHGHMGKHWHEREAGAPTPPAPSCSWNHARFQMGAGTGSLPTTMTACSPPRCVTQVSSATRCHLTTLITVQD